MAVVQDIYGQKVTGKAGPVSFFISRGKTIMRALPKTSGGKRSENQLRNQRRFQELRSFCTPFKTILIPRIWNDLATTSSGYHLFMKANSPAFDRDGILADPMKIRLSMGKLTLPTGMQAQRTGEGGGSLQVQWEDQPTKGSSSSNDQLLVISAGAGNFSAIKAAGLTRADLGGTFELPELAWSASYVYLFFESPDQRYYSESVCLEI